MVSTRGTALLVTSEHSVEQWMIECVTSMGFGHITVEKPGEIEQIQDSLSLCLVDLGASEGLDWRNILDRARIRHSLLPGVLLSRDSASTAVLRDALGAGIVDILSMTEDISDIRPRLDRIVQRVEAVSDIRRAITALGSLTEDRDRKAEAGGSPAEAPEQKTVLLVGGENSLGEAADALVAAEIHVVRAESFQQARAAIQENRFQVLVVDNDLPDASGLEAMRDMAAAIPEARILFVVGFTAADDAVQALRWGAASFLIKPIGSQQLLDQVQSLMQAPGPQAGPTIVAKQAEDAVVLLEDAIARLCSR